MRGFCTIVVLLAELASGSLRIATVELAAERAVSMLGRIKVSTVGIARHIGRKAVFRGSLRTSQMAREATGTRGGPHLFQISSLLHEYFVAIVVVKCVT